MARYAVILAEGLPVESYLDIADQANSDGGGTIRLHPEFGARPGLDAATTRETRGAAVP